MPRTKSNTPTYCRHKRTGRGYATVDGHQKFFPGLYDSPESRAAYDALIGQWLGNGRKLPTEPVAGITLSVVALAFWKHAQAFYRHADGTPTREAENYRPALRALRRLYGATAAADFGPKTLRALRAAMLLPTEETDPAGGPKVKRPGWSRNYANRQTARIKQIFKWAAADELIPATVPAALDTVEAIRAGRDGARETDAVEPVADSVVETMLPHLPPPVAAMVRLQRLTAARGGELFKLRTCDIDTSGPVWKFRPTQHKTAHRGHRRVIRFGPQAREILEPLLKLDTTAYLFNPADAIAWRNEKQKAKRQTPMTPSQRRRAEEAAKRPRRTRGHYDKNSYAQAIERACDKAGVQHWSPHQLRHAAGTAYRREGDFEAAKIILGHQTDSMTEHYAQRDDRKVDEIVARIG